ncbi:ELM2 domain [Popillia japonica]|uniref:ELM2 domain n=1 Tax=Popillia japonica TaxID=7064 RepID=A0AAW1M2I0_POPJA
MFNCTIRQERRKGSYEVLNEGIVTCLTVQSDKKEEKGQQNTTNKTSVSSTSPQSKVTSTTSSNNNAGKNEPKPVECNLCHRKFKNIPALNGHMRLHGGYFKKDADNKKCEKKDSAGPPLQTASVSVRALIEEKIINKRNINPSQNSTVEETPTSRTSAPPLFPLTVHSPATSNNSNPDVDTKTNSFVVPAPPQHATDKARRHSDAEAFTVPRTPNNNNSTQQEAEALADLILKREKVTVKRATSDPGQSPQIIQFQSGDSFTLTGVTYQSEDGGYLSPSLQDEVFTQVQDTMLLQGVDAQQLASIQFQTESLLQEHTEQQLQDITLDDYTQSSHSVNQDLQAVLDSPLPESLAEFSAFHSGGSLDLPSPNYQTQSPAQYTGSPHTSLAAQSPLQSPLVRHDSPAYTYPTPPASHEGQSPCFGQNTILPMVSPKQSDYITRELDQNPQTSLLSAEFFSSTMSSSAAVEEALEEVLPGENIAADDLYPSLTNSPPPQSPLSIGLTPVPSPLSNIPNTSVASPHTQTNFVPSPGNIQFSHYTLQSHMLPNSDDPLLSSSPKDFQTKKKFEFNGVPLKVIGNGILDANFTGILLDANGEIKFIQTGGAFQAKNIVLTTPHIVTTQTVQRTEEDLKRQQKQQPKMTVPMMKQQVQRPRFEQIKQEESNDVFLSPTTITASPVKNPRKRPRAEPLQLPILHQSRLRATRSKPQGSARFTPLPILNPTRPGTGLYCNLKQKHNTENLDSQETNNWNEPVPESDSTPHINVGPQFQCKIPPCNQDNRHARKPHREDLLWDPGINNSTESEIDMYLDFACCAAIPGGGRNKEYAMHILHLTGGNIHEAMLKLMQPMPILPSDNPLHYYNYSESDRWTVSETEIFHQALLKHDKDFAAIAQEVETKTIKQCIQFYYVWKKVCVDEYKRLKLVRERKSGYVKLAECEQEEKPYPDAKLLGIADTGSPIQDHRNFMCEFTDCSASFNSRAALNGHIRIHGGTARNSPTYSHVSHERRPPSITSSLCHSTDPTEDYPCKICGKVFTKIKSRSAHMKSHRPPDAEPIKRKEKDVVVSSNFDASVPSPFST